KYPHVFPLHRITTLSNQGTECSILPRLRDARSGLRRENRCGGAATTLMSGTNYGEGTLRFVVALGQYTVCCIFAIKAKRLPRLGCPENDRIRPRHGHRLVRKAHLWKPDTGKT